VLRRNILDRQFVRITHSTKEDRAAKLKHAQRRLRAIVPLASHERRVTAIREHLRPGRLAGEVLLDSKERASGHEHCTRGNADSTLHRTHAIHASESCPLRSESVEARCSGVRVAEHADGVSALIVTEEEENIGTCRVCCEEPPGQSQGEERDKSANAGAHQVALACRGSCLKLIATFCIVPIEMVGLIAFPMLCVINVFANSVL
jgi:hypothetical protein